MKIGYARISTHDQNLSLQKRALKKAGCRKIFTDIKSGASSDRVGLNQAIEYLRKGDALVVWRLDRLARSLKNLIEIITALQNKKIGLRSLQENIDTTTSGGKLILHVFGALAEFEREIITERTKAGLAAARARGRVGGRPRLMDKKKIALAKAMHRDPKNNIASIYKTLNISKATLYRYLN
jgi:DNA invertase Pin-like site-specific DNA recombinase